VRIELAAAPGAGAHVREATIDGFPLTIGLSLESA
jgi:hypothetical protein